MECKYPQTIITLLERFPKFCTRNSYYISYFFFKEYYKNIALGTLLMLQTRVYRGMLRQQQNSSKWGSEVRAIIANGISKPKKGHDVGDHPPITPMKPACE